MRRLTLKPLESNILYAVLNRGNGNGGYSVADLRKVLPVLDKLESKAKRDKTAEGETLTFTDTQLELKESEFGLVKSLLEGSNGWSALQGRQVIQLLEKMEELPQVKEG